MVGNDFVRQSALDKPKYDIYDISYLGTARKDRVRSLARSDRKAETTSKPKSTIKHARLSYIAACHALEYVDVVASEQWTVVYRLHHNSDVWLLSAPQLSYRCRPRKARKSGEHS
jgi:hypothetical protein